MDVDGDSNKSSAGSNGDNDILHPIYMKNSTSTSEDVRHVSVYLKKAP